MGHQAGWPAGAEGAGSRPPDSALPRGIAFGHDGWRQREENEGPEGGVEKSRKLFVCRLREAR